MATADFKNFLASIINQSQSVAGAPIQQLALPYQVTAYGQRPRDFTFVDPASGLPTKALAVVEDLYKRSRIETSPRNIATYNNGSPLPVGNYYIGNNPTSLHTGRRKDTYQLAILVRVADTDPAVAGRNLDYLVEAIETTFRNLLLPIALTDAVTGQGYYLRNIGVSSDTQLMRPIKATNQNLIKASKRLILPDVEVDYFG